MDTAEPPNGGVQSVPIGKRPEGTYAADSTALDDECETFVHAKIPQGCGILAIDSSTEVLSLALSTDAGMQHIEIDAGAKHSEFLMIWIDRLFESAGIAPKDLGLTIIMKGPGSFTGLRIGYATAKGLSLALGIPFAAVPTLDCIARGYSIWPGLVLPVLDAKKNCFFAALYRNGNRLTGYLDADTTALLTVLKAHCASPDEKVLITGAGAQLCASRLENSGVSVNLSLDPYFSRGRATELLHFLKTQVRIELNEGLYSGPLYIRKSDAELNLSL
jgi:tRNA threonylcarbamoyladenosine biosynthesis protein TsaB